MALQKTTTSPQGIEVANAYHRVENVQLGKQHINYVIKSYASKAHVVSFARRDYVAQYNMDAANPWEQAYAHAKTQPEWDGCEDC
jgi:serine protease inhibitor